MEDKTKKETSLPGMMPVGTDLAGDAIPHTPTRSSKPLLIGIIAITAAFGAGAYMSLKSYTSQEQIQGTLTIYERNVLGGPEPETFTEINGVRYFSRVDGKDIGELLR